MLVGETMGLPGPAFHLWVTTSDSVLHLCNSLKTPLLGSSALQAETLKWV